MALALAAENNPQLNAAAAQVAAASAGITTAKAYPNPEVAMMAGRQTIAAPGNINGMVHSYSLTQPLELGALRPTRLEYAQRGRESSERSLAEIRLAVLSAVRRTFFQALRKRAEIDLLLENLRLVEELRKRIQVRVDVGEAGRLELIRADAEVTTSRTAVNNARLQSIAALAQLRAAIGASVDPDATPSGTLDPEADLPSLDRLRVEVLQRHPSLALGRAEVRRAEARLAMETAMRRPQPALRAEIDQPPDSPTYRVGIAIPLPVWNKREGPIAEASALVTQANALARSRQLLLIAALESAFGRYQEASQQLASLAQGPLREAEEAVRIAQTAYQLGERGILEVLDAQRVLRTVRLDYLNAQYDRQAALIDLDELRAVELRRIP
ncbi:MAG: TolC family protein [Bryobacterales bacterium]|nr:TolC family protein [Bryobacterales bacterium]